MNNEYKTQSKIFKIELGTKCKDLREKNNVPRIEISRRIGCTVQQVKNFEEGYTFDPAIYIYYCERFNNYYVIGRTDL